MSEPATMKRGFLAYWRCPSCKGETKVEFECDYVPTLTEAQEARARKWFDEQVYDHVCMTFAGSLREYPWT